MGRLLRHIVCLLPLTLVGCFGLSQNPSYFPFYLPTGDIVRTHAKPPGFGYFSNFDPHAVCLEVIPLESSGPTKSQFLVVATVSDENGQPRRSRRVEWMLEGVGNIVEVDESGYFQGRGYKVDNKYAVSYTGNTKQTLQRASGNEIQLPPGQTWCLITSATEGDTLLTVYAPEIANWSRHKVVVTRHWVDADIQFPPSVVCPQGSSPTLATQVIRSSDKQPASNYKVRYRVLDGSPVHFQSSRGAEAEVASDATGEAKVSLSCVGPANGPTRVAVEVVRPDPSAPTGPGIVVGRGETVLEWQAPNLALSVEISPNAVVGQEIVVTHTVTNSGAAESQPSSLRMPMPDGLLFVRSDRQHVAEAGQITWQIPAIPAGGTETATAVFRSPRSGTATVTASLRSTDGIQTDGKATVKIAVPELQLKVEGMRAGAPGEPIRLEVICGNGGTGPANKVAIRADFDPMLEHESKANPLEVNLGTIEPGRSQKIPLILTPRKSGMTQVRLVAIGDGGLRVESTQTIAIASRTLELNVSGPTQQSVGQPGQWNVQVANPGDSSIEKVRVSVRVPKELTVQGASQGGRVVGDQLIWELPGIAARETQTLQLSALGTMPVTGAVLSVAAQGDKTPEARGEFVVDLVGRVALKVSTEATRDTVQVRNKITYTIRVSNNGDATAQNVVVTALAMPPHLKLLNATGASSGKVTGDKAVFAALDRLEPGRNVTYTLEVEAGQAGDGRVQIEVIADGMAKPIVDEEATRVVP